MGFADRNSHITGICVPCITLQPVPARRRVFNRGPHPNTARLQESSRSEKDYHRSKQKTIRTLWYSPLLEKRIFRPVWRSMARVMTVPARS
jgi:hypothetical protein